MKIHLLLMTLAFSCISLPGYTKALSNKMANCKINALSNKNQDNENLPRQGLVTEVCREWVLHEDQALAHRLQHEEYQNHLGSNKERNALLRQDTPKAREEQLKLDEEAAKAQNVVEVALAKQEARDASVAYAIASELDRIEEEKKKQQEIGDRLFAKSLAEEDKKKVRQMKELRQVEREAAYLGINSGLDNVALLSRKEKRPKPKGEKNEKAVSSSKDLHDLSDFCLKPNTCMDEEEIRILQEDQDEELARLLQEQDLKRRGDLLQEDQLMAIETQDKELAKILQEQEKAKAKKGREKARQKALLRKRLQQSNNEQQPEQESSLQKAATPQSSPNRYEPQHDYDTVPSDYYQRPSSPQYAVPNFVTQENYPTSVPIVPESFSERPRGEISPTPTNETYRNFPPKSNPSPIEQYANIACAIDPTYQRRVMQGELIPPAPAIPPLSTEPELPSPSPPSSQTRPNFKNKQSSPNHSLFEEYDNEDYLPPPYMPIQGQRRYAPDPVERRPTPTKLIKEKLPKDNGCKQQ